MLGGGSSDEQEERNDPQTATPQAAQPAPPGQVMTATKDDVARALREIIAEFGPERRAPRLPTVDSYDTETDEAVYSEYTGCRYVIDNKPSCIAAQVCFKLGLATVEQMSEWDTLSDGNSESFYAVTGLDLTHDAMELVNQAQRIQDGIAERRDDPALPVDSHLGKPWGLVLSELGL